MRSRLSLIAETLLLAGFCVALLVWIIPAQTSEGGFGLSPAFLPTALTAALLALLVLDGGRRLVSRRAEPAYPTGIGALGRIIGLAVLGALILRFGGIVPAGAVTSAAGMVILGERRALPVLGTAIICGATLWLAFG
jgi:hypothetical protein